MPQTLTRRRNTPLTPEESFVDGHLTHTALVSIAILTFITFVGNFTQLQLSAALPTIVAEFGISVTTGQWLTSIFQLVMGVMVPLTAFLTRRFTTRQIVITSMLVFTIGSLLAWLSPTFPLVLLGRMLEAIGTGVMWPVLQITVFSIYPLSRRGMAMGVVGMAMSVAPAIGPTFGGWQTDANGWRSIFLTLSVIGAVALVLAFGWLRNFGTTDRTVKADFFSVALSVFGFGGLMFGFTNIENYPITSPMTWLPMLIGVIGIIWFVTRQLSRKRAWVAAQATQTTQAATQSTDDTAEGAASSASTQHDAPRGRFHRWHRTTGKEPLLDLEVLHNRSFTIGTCIASLAFFAFSSIAVIMPLYIQDDRGYSATMSGLIMLPGAIGQAIAQFCGGRALDRFGARPVALVGSLLLLVGTTMMSTISMTSWIWWVSIWQFIRQAGMGFVMMPITTWSLNCLEPNEVSAGSAVTNTARQIAGAIGAPVLVIIMETFTAMHGGDAAEANVFGVQWALRISALLCLGMVLMVLFGVRGNGAGSTRDLTQRALRRMHAMIEHED